MTKCIRAGYAKSATTRAALWLMAIGFLCKLSACAAEEKRTISTNAVGSVVSEEKFKEIAIGGRCVIPNGKSVNDPNVCQDLEAFSRDGLDPYLPSEVKVEHVINPAASGGGYIYRLRWKFTQPTAFKNGEARFDWSVFEDESAKTKPIVTSWNDFLDTLTPQHLAPDNHEQFVSQKLFPGRRYVYYLAGNVLGFKDSQHVGVNVQMVYYRVVVDLTKAVPPK